MANQYSAKKYITKDRWNNYWHQIMEIRSFEGAKEILEIGIGNKIISDYLKKFGYSVKTLDINSELNPDYVASVENIPLPDKSFDLVLAAEILEHLPFSEFEICLKEIRRVARQGVVISLPHSGYTFSFSFKIPLIKWKRFIFKIPHFCKTKTSILEHCWEIGQKGFSAKKISDVIKKAGFKISDKFIPADDPAHVFFILKLKDE